MESIQLQFTNRLVEFVHRSGPLAGMLQQSPAEPAARFDVDSSQPLTFFQGLQGPGTMFESGEQLDVTHVSDGTSNTIMLVESLASVPWTRPGGLLFDLDLPFPELGGLGFEDVVFIALVDGSTQAIDHDTDRQRLKRVATRNGGERL